MQKEFFLFLYILYTCSITIFHYRLYRVKTTSGRNLLRECGTYSTSTLNKSIIIITSFISVWRFLISIPWVTCDCTVCDRNKKDFRCCGWPKVGRQPSSFYHSTLSPVACFSEMDWMQMSQLLSPKWSSLFPPQLSLTAPINHNRLNLWPPGVLHLTLNE